MPWALFVAVSSTGIDSYLCNFIIMWLIINLRRKNKL
jgi:hypothetical protein